MPCSTDCIPMTPKTPYNPNRQPKLLPYVLVFALLVLIAGYCLPYQPQIPVASATNSDWNKKSFWAYPWGRSVTHKGIDIFAPKGKPILSATGGWVVASGQDDIGGNIVAVLGPKWRISYYAHLHENYTQKGQWLTKGDTIGSVGNSGNAAGKAPHLHYAVLSLLPYPWRYDNNAPQGYLKMFYLKPDDYFR